jgi:DNA polymerase III delta prime subunit
LDLLIEISEGDLRRSINTLQTCYSFVKGSNIALSMDDIQKVSGVVPDQVIASVFNKIKVSRGY